MATDHRGRELHAGKRTAQEMGWSSLGFDSGAFSAGTLIDPWRGTGAPLGNMSAWRNEGDQPTNWRVTKHEETPSSVGISETPQDLGRGKYSTQTSTGGKAVFGKVRTPARAIIAAEAMNKRIEEGRDLKTGRPKK